MSWTGSEQKLVLQSLNWGGARHLGKDRAGVMWEVIKGKRKGMKSSERGRGGRCRAKQQLLPLYLVAPSRFSAHILLYWGGKMSGTEEAEWILVWVFFPSSWFLSAAGNTENISKQSLKLAVCILPVKFPVAHKLDSHPCLPGKADAFAELGRALGCSH